MTIGRNSKVGGGTLRQVTQQLLIAQRARHIRTYVLLQPVTGLTLTQLTKS